MKIAVLGGGGFRVPMVYGALLARAERLGLEQVALYDLEEGRLAQIAPVLEGLERERGTRLAFSSTTRLDDALDGADFVFCAIRVGNLEGRVVDERVPLDEGVVGQETTGPGGLCFALRTVPVMVDVARRVAERAPQAWFVNFTNPAGLVTEAIRAELGDRAVGICDSPAGFASDTVEALRSGLQSRAEFLLRQQAAFYGENGRTPEAALEAWRTTRREREETYFAEAHAAAGISAPDDDWEDVGGYEGEALAVVEAIALNQRRVLILDTANRSSLPFLDADAVVEVPCVVGSAGVVPVAVGEVPGHARALVETIKEVERMTIRAALTQSRELAVKALALHPLVPSVNTARRIFDSYAGRQAELTGVFS